MVTTEVLAGPRSPPASAPSIGAGPSLPPSLTGASTTAASGSGGSGSSSQADTASAATTSERKGKVERRQSMLFIRVLQVRAWVAKHVFRRGATATAALP